MAAYAKCEVCGREEDWRMHEKFIDISGKLYCDECAIKVLDKATENILITSTQVIEGHKIRKYIDFVSVETVLGTGLFSELEASLADLTGTHSTGFESKLNKVKESAMKKIKYQALQKGANAIVGIDLDYTVFSNNLIGLIVNGTLVLIE